MELKTCEKRTIIRLNIGGTCFQTFNETLRMFPNSKLANLSIISSDYDAENNEYFFDRNPVLFAFILDSYRKQEIHLPSDICGPTFRKELEFWGLSQSLVAPCCWEALYRSDDDIKTVNKLLEHYTQNAKTIARMRSMLRKRLWMLLEDPHSSHLAMAWVTLISILVLVSTTVEIMMSLPEFSEEFSESEKHAVELVLNMYDKNNVTIQRIQSMKPNRYLSVVVTVCHVVLTIELLISFIVCPSKKAYAVNMIRISVLLGYIAFWVSFAIERKLSILNNMPSVVLYILSKHGTILKLGRLFYLSKYVPAFNVVGLTLSECKSEFKILVFLLGIFVCVFGYVMFAIECFYNERMNNMFATMYWALITLTTVGYGDMVPTSKFGHVIAAACAVCGVIVLALPISIIASTFNKFYCFNSYVSTHVKLHANETNGIEDRTEANKT